MHFDSSARNEGSPAWRVAAARTCLAATIAVAAGCGQEPRTTGEAPRELPRSGGTFVMAQDAPNGLDPAYVDDVYEATVVNQIFDGLLAFDMHLNTVPGVASSWVISADGTEYTFALRRGVHFHDGSPVTAEDAAYSLQRVFDLPEEDVGLARQYLCHILGTDDYVHGRTPSIRGLEVVSPDTLSIRLSKPYASFLAVLASELARIVPKHYVEQVGAAEFARHPVGCGPFRFAHWDADRIVLTRFAEYGRCPVYLDSLVFELPAENARDYAVSRLLEGRISAAVVPDGRLSELQAQRTLPLLLRQELSLSFIGLNQNRKPFDDVRVRRAFAHAIDQDALVRSPTGGRILPNGILPPGMPGYTPEIKRLAHDPEQARRLLAEAGYPNGEGLPPIIHTSANQSEQARRLFEDLRAQVARVGFDLRSELLGWREFSNRLTTQDLQCFTVTWVADIPDPDSFLSPMCSSGGAANFEGYTSPEVDALLLHGRGTRSSLERLKVYQTAERLVLRDAPIVPLFHPLGAMLVLGNVRDLQLTAMGVGNLAMEKVWLASESGASPQLTNAAVTAGATTAATAVVESEKRVSSQPSNTARGLPTVIPGRIP